MSKSCFSMKCSRFTVYKGDVEVGVIIPCSGGWMFVGHAYPYFFHPWPTPELALAACEVSL